MYKKARNSIDKNKEACYNLGGLSYNFANMVRKSLPGNRKLLDYDRCMASIDAFFNLRGGNVQ